MKALHAFWNLFVHVEAPLTLRILNNYYYAQSSINKIK